ncbi:MAG: hypothetical protein WD118_03560 [Phycisphaeraceae bacterium]
MIPNNNDHPPARTLPSRAHRVIWNLILWTFVCGLAAVPSFVFATEGDFNHAGMVVGVVIFIIAYTLVASTDRVQRLKAQPALRYTFYTGYGTRLAVSVLFVIGIVAGDNWVAFLFLLPALFLDMLPGVLSSGVSAAVVGGMAARGGGFVRTLLQTLVQGAFLNIILAVYMLIVFAIVRPIVGKRYTGPWQCEACGYDLRGSQHSQACPECGAVRTSAVISQRAR